MGKTNHFFYCVGLEKRYSRAVGRGQGEELDGIIHVTRNHRSEKEESCSWLQRKLPGKFVCKYLLLSLAPDEKHSIFVEWKSREFRSGKAFRCRENVTEVESKFVQNPQLTGN